MNTYKIKAVDWNAVVVEYTVNKVVTTEKYDARYLPVDDAVALDDFCNEQLAGLSSDATALDICDEVKAMVNVSKNLVVEVIAVIPVA